VTLGLTAFHYGARSYSLLAVLTRVESLLGYCCCLSRATNAVSPKDRDVRLCRTNPKKRVCRMRGERYVCSVDVVLLENERSTALTNFL
jgi:hypothetical protein